MKGLEIAAAEVRLVREAGDVLIYSYERATYERQEPGGKPERTPMPSRDQPREWHEGHALLALAQKLDAYRKARRRSRR